MSMTSLNARRAKADRAKKAAMITHSEWIGLGALALEAAERARAANDAHAENRYVALARKCDACAEQVWESTASLPLTLVVRSIRTASVPDGFLVTLGLSREQIRKLRAMCDKLSAAS